MDERLSIWKLEMKQLVGSYKAPYLNTSPENKRQMCGWRLWPTFLCTLYCAIVLVAGASCWYSLQNSKNPHKDIELESELLRTRALNFPMTHPYFQVFLFYISLFLIFLRFFCKFFSLYSERYIVFISLK
jgi:hypothetical protein